MAISDGAAGGLVGSILGFMAGFLSGGIGTDRQLPERNDVRPGIIKPFDVSPLYENPDGRGYVFGFKINETPYALRERADGRPQLQEYRVVDEPAKIEYVAADTRNNPTPAPDK